MPAPSSEETTAAPLQFASPPTPSRDLEVVLDKYRGFSRPLRYLAIDTAVARPEDDGPHPVQLRPICLCHPTGDTRSSFSAPFHLSLSDRGAALRPPVEDQQSLGDFNYFMLNLPRLHGAHNPSTGSEPCRPRYRGCDCWRWRHGVCSGRRTPRPALVRRTGAWHRPPIQPDAPGRGNAGRRPARLRACL